VTVRTVDLADLSAVRLRQECPDLGDVAGPMALAILRMLADPSRMGVTLPSPEHNRLRQDVLRAVLGYVCADCGALGWGLCTCGRGE
jgi:hypothetical protein